MHFPLYSCMRHKKLNKSNCLSLSLGIKLWGGDLENDLKKYGYKLYPLQQEEEVFLLHNPEVNRPPLASSSCCICIVAVSGKFLLFHLMTWNQFLNTWSIRLYSQYFRHISKHLIVALNDFYNRNQNVSSELHI